MTKRLVTKTRIMKKMLNDQNNAMKDHVKNAKINYSP